MTWEISIISIAISIFTLTNVITKSQTYKSDIVFCCLLILLNIPFIHVAMEHLEIGAHLFRAYSNPSLNLLYGPLLLFYVLILVSEKLRFKPSYLCHSLPFILFYLLFIFMSPPLPQLPANGAVPGFELDPGSMPRPALELELGSQLGLIARSRPGLESGPIPRSRLITGSELRRAPPGINPPPNDESLTNKEAKFPVGLFFENDLLQYLITNFGFINFSSFLFYSTLIIVSLVRHQKNISGIFSQNDNQISLKWIYSLPVLFTFLLFMNFFNGSGMRVSPNILFLGMDTRPDTLFRGMNTDPNTVLLNLHLTSHLVFIVLLCFFGVKQRPVFKFKTSKQIKENKTLDDRIEEERFNGVAGENNSSSSTPSPCCGETMSQEQVDHFIQKMNTHMMQEKPYLQANFSAYDLAHAIELPRRKLPYVLNNKLSINFFQYVNGYRVEEVKSRLQDPQDNSTILDMALESGFNSKSSFNSLFKKYCHATPSEYRKSSLKEN